MNLLRNTLLIASLFVSTGFGSMPNAWAMECPKPEPLGGKAGPPAELVKQLASNDVLTEVPGILGHLNQQFPGAGRQALADYLIAAYCPVIGGRTDLNEQEKLVKVKEFGDKVIATEY